MLNIGAQALTIHPRLKFLQLNAKSSEGVCHHPVSINVRLRRTEGQTEEIAADVSAAGRARCLKKCAAMTPRTTSQPTSLFWVMIEPLGAWPALEVTATDFRGHKQS
jgi:hypothetical protein